MAVLALRGNETDSRHPEQQYLDLLRQVVLGTVVDTIVAIPTWALVRRSLEGALPEDPRRRRRRRAYTTGGLSPLTKSR